VKKPKEERWIAYFDDTKTEALEIIKVMAKEAGAVCEVRTCHYFEGPEPWAEKAFMCPKVPKYNQAIIKKAYGAKVSIIGEPKKRATPKAK
jgi:hypothetical protein